MAAENPNLTRICRHIGSTKMVRAKSFEKPEEKLF
ncbi:hypothetical protein CCACVL1_02245 [Corchorus capsularis]|uniref:Uncharacterized protein n=1 Tax=Corchorus capsularis TaxID=210143 RepID=A0A1R3K9V6_COCAP|nr:hypothetical protein CCACVL1_02245 [Corchorus capsularis]